MNTIEKSKQLEQYLDLVAEFYLREMVRREYSDWPEYETDFLQYHEEHNRSFIYQTAA